VKQISALNYWLVKLHGRRGVVLRGHVWVERVSVDLQWQVVQLLFRGFVVGSNLQTGDFACQHQFLHIGLALLGASLNWWLWQGCSFDLGNLGFCQRQLKDLVFEFLVLLRVIQEVSSAVNQISEFFVQPKQRLLLFFTFTFQLLHLGLQLCIFCFQPRLAFLLLLTCLEVFSVEPVVLLDLLQTAQQSSGHFLLLDLMERLFTFRAQILLDLG